MRQRRCGSGSGTLGGAALAAVALVALGAAPVARAAVPYPPCQAPACTDPLDWAAYLFLPPGVLPDDYAFDPANPSSGSGWKYAPSGSLADPGPGMNVTAAWQVTTGRPDTVVAVLDSGIRWDEPDLARKLAPNRGELPEPCPGYDCDANGVVNPDDWAGVACPGGVVSDANGNGHLDGQDLIAACSDGVDDDANGFVDDIAGWDFWQDDNDPFDDVDAGHGTGEGEDMVGEADNGGGFPGVAPSAMFVPVRVGDHFVALDSDFVQGVIYAVERGVDVVSEALGTLGATRLTQAAIDYAYHRGIPVIASAADEQSNHSNWPAAAEHTIWVNSITKGDGTFVGDEEDFRVQNGCTNHGGKAWVAISSTGCSSEATGRSAGITLLLLSHGKNLVEAGALDPYPGLDTPFSAEEVRQIFRAAAQDVDRSLDPPILPGLPFGPVIEGTLSGATPETQFRTARFDHGPGWDEYSGYGRPDVLRMLEIAETAIPPEADLSGSVRWFEPIDPTPRRPVVIRGTAAAVRTPGPFTYTVEVGCGLRPQAWQTLRQRSAVAPLRRVPLARWRPADTAAWCGFDPAAPVSGPDDHTVTLRLRVVDRDGTVGEDRRTVSIHADPDTRWVRELRASGEGSPKLADVDRDGVLDVVFGAADGRVHALRGRDGRSLPGFPARTRAIPTRERRMGVEAWRRHLLPVPHEGVLASVAVDDLDGDRRVEIVAASTEGRLYVWDDHGRLRPGFPVASDPAFSAPERRDKRNDVDPGFASSPALVDLDAPGGDGDLEIVLGGLDGHVYAWRHDGTPVPGFPARLGDTARLLEDPVTGRWLPKDAGVRERLAKILSSPAVGDLDGDGANEIVIATNEEYVDGAPLFSTDGSPLLTLLVAVAPALGLGDFAVDTAGRLYALERDGALRAGFPVRVPLIAPGLLPTVATGTPGSPALGAVEPGAGLAAAIGGAAGPLFLFREDGSPLYGVGSNGAPEPLAVDFPGGFPAVPDPAGLVQPETFSNDAPFVGALGSPALGDLDGDGAPEVAAPTGGIRQLIDVAAPASQEFGDHQVAAWHAADGSLLPGFPRVMDDMQFFTEPALADVDGDGLADVVGGSGAYLVRAYRHDGGLAPGWPKFTHGWVVATPVAGDIDGDGLVEVVVPTREGRLFAWDTPAPASAEALPWPGFGRDRRNTRNLDSGVPVEAPPRHPFEAFLWWLEAILIQLFGL